MVIKNLCGTFPQGDLFYYHHKAKYESESYKGSFVDLIVIVVFFFAVPNGPR